MQGGWQGKSSAKTNDTGKGCAKTNKHILGKQLTVNALQLLDRVRKLKLGIYPLVCHVARVSERSYSCIGRECAPLSPHLRWGRNAEPNDGTMSTGPVGCMWSSIHLTRASPCLPGWVGWVFFLTLQLLVRLENSLLPPDTVSTSDSNVTLESTQ